MRCGDIVNISEAMAEAALKADSLGFLIGQDVLLMARKHCTGSCCGWSVGHED